MSNVMRITLKAYDHELIDQSAKKIIDTVRKSGAEVSRGCAYESHDAGRRQRQYQDGQQKVRTIA